MLKPKIQEHFNYAMSTKAVINEEATNITLNRLIAIIHNDENLFKLNNQIVKQELSLV